MTPTFPIARRKARFGSWDSAWNASTASIMPLIVAALWSVVNSVTGMMLQSLLRSPELLGTGATDCTSMS